MNLYETTLQRTVEQQQHIPAAQDRQLQRLRYEVHRARRQYDLADPENRLVAQELERRWESALQAPRKPSRLTSRTDSACEPTRKNGFPELRTQMGAAGQALPRLWPQLPTATRKELLRCLIDKVVLTRCPRRRSCTSASAWRGGADTEKELSVPTPLHHAKDEYPALVQRALTLVDSDLSDVQVAEKLTAEGFRSISRQRACAGTVGASAAKPASPKAVPPAWSPHPPAPCHRHRQALGVHRLWFYHHIYRGVIKIDRDPTTGRYLFPDTPTPSPVCNNYVTDSS